MPYIRSIRLPFNVYIFKIFSPALIMFTYNRTFSIVYTGMIYRKTLIFHSIFSWSKIPHFHVGVVLARPIYNFGKQFTPVFSVSACAISTNLHDYLLFLYTKFVQQKYISTFETFSHINGTNSMFLIKNVLLLNNTTELLKRFIRMPIVLNYMQ